MTEPLPRADVDALLDRAGARANRDILADIIRSAYGLAGDDVDRLDLKITAAAVAEMREAFAVFAPYAHVPKVTIFGSARTLPDNPLYAQAKSLAAELADRDWMVVTGAGPGIMAAGMEGAGRERSIGVTIRLPFEEAANEFIQDDPKLVTMKYFFTRKLMLVKESSGFVALPGGFGTQDETFELCTLQQTGKAEPAPIALLDTPHGSYWDGWASFVRTELVANGLVSPVDQSLYLITDDVTEACDHLTGFYRNYHSIRWVRERLVIRVRQAPDDRQLGELNDAFEHCLLDGRFERTEPLPAERSTGEHLELPRLVSTFDPFCAADLHQVIATLNGWVR